MRQCSLPFTSRTFDLAIDYLGLHNFLKTEEIKLTFLLADRTATQYDRLAVRSAIGISLLSVRPSVTLCIVALRVGVHG